ncbi:hypothetical protein BC832DRAFT_591213 [Gaertneriomyces semiglobifer]|nr:hypothetical protein BC832DRAFT_591213 [Gaertneriomyces semiglobifer]
MNQTIAHQQLMETLREFDPYIVPGSISLVDNPDNDGKPDIRLSILEQVWLLIRLEGDGYRIIHVEPADGSGKAEEIRRDFLGTRFEQMDMLLDTVSPLYREKFGRRLYKRLEAL